MTHPPSTPDCLRRRMSRTLLALGIAVCALAATASPARAASVVVGCFQRPLSDKFSYSVRVDLRVWNAYQRVWQPTGQSKWIVLSNANAVTYYDQNGLQGDPTPTCATLIVPAAYQSYITTLVVDHTYTANQTSIAYFGASSQTAPAGNQLAIFWQPAVVLLNNLSSPYSYWH